MRKVRLNDTFPACLQWASVQSNAIWLPPVDIYRHRRGWLLKFELPGINEEDIKIQVSGQELRLTGRRKDFTCHKTMEQFHLEISYADFERIIEFPVSVEGCRLETEIEQGMCLINLEESDDENKR